jgi:hypothetical protein
MLVSFLLEISEAQELLVNALKSEQLLYDLRTSSVGESTHIMNGRARNNRLYHCMNGGLPAALLRNSLGLGLQRWLCLRFLGFWSRRETAQSHQNRDVKVTHLKLGFTPYRGLRCLEQQNLLRYLFIHVIQCKFLITTIHYSIPPRVNHRDCVRN